MSLISDPNYLIHNLRLTYLRHVDDPYGPRIISLNPRHSSNPHVVAAGLADVDRWPELAIPSSPLPTDDEGTAVSSGRHGHSGFPGAASLKYSQTIMGPSRTGAMGMRVSGKRVTQKDEPPLPPLPHEVHTKRLRSDSAPTPVVPQVTDSPEHHDDSLIVVSKRRSAGGSSLSDIPISLVDSNELGDSEPPKPLQFMPNFGRGKEMEARRRERMRARFTSTVNDDSRPQNPPIHLNPEGSSEDDGDLTESLAEDDGEFDEFIEPDEGMEGEADDFDPDFAPPRIGASSDSASDAISIASVSNSALSTSHSSMFTSSLQVTQSIRNRNRLSPVAEGRVPSKRLAAAAAAATDSNGSSAPAHPRPANPSVDSYFEMVTPPVPSHRPSDDQLRPHRPRAPSQPPEIHTHAPQSDELTFTRRKVPPVHSSESALTTKLASSKGTSSNPYTELYSLISGRAETASMTVNVFIPHAQSPSGKALQLNVRKDATVEEVIGFALWSYWEEGWLPKLDSGLGGEDDPKRNTKLSAIGWVMRIAEDDGEVDEDFPAPDRMGKISKFNFDAYAILEANAAQIAQNQQLESKLVRRPSRIIVAKKKPEPVGLAPPATMGPSTSAISGSMLGTSVGLSTSLGLSSSHGPQVLLRVRVADIDTAVHYSTTISVYAGMYMQEVLEMVCRKRKITNLKEWALLLGDPKILIPLDRTVASLQGKSDLVLVKRTMLPQYGFNVDGDRAARTTDPNASIFKRISEVPEVKFSAEMDITAAYKRFTVFRKLPMLVARLERTLAIDGEYIHIMPPVNKARAVFDSMRTSSYHIKDVVGCTQSAKSSSNFKFLVKRDGGDKRYDFEAETPKIANEIVASIRNLKSSLDRSGTMKQSRRSRHVG